MRDLINHDDETTCPKCNGVGRVMKTGKLDGTALANEHLNMVKDAPEEINVANTQKIVKRVSDLTIPEFKNLMVECFEMLKQRELDTSKKEYDKITTKRVVVDDVSTRNGVPVPKEY